MRELLTAARTYYVRTDGNDAHDGLTDSAAGALLTTQAAIGKSMALDSGSFDVTIQMGDGTRTAGGVFDGALVGNGHLILTGNAANPGNVVITVDAGDAINATRGADIIVQNMKLQAANGDAIRAIYGGRVTFNNVIFGPSLFHLEAYWRGEIFNAGNYTIAAGGTAHAHAYGRGYIHLTDGTVTITGTPNFSSFFAGCADAQIACSVTFSGSATGPRFLVHKNGIIDVNTPTPENYFPGTTRGNVVSGGNYVGVTDGWTAFTPVVTADGVHQPTCATTGRYRLENGWCEFQAHVTITTRNSATGPMYVSLPVAADTDSHSTCSAAGYLDAAFLMGFIVGGYTSVKCYLTGGVSPFNSDGQSYDVSGRYAY